MLAVLADWFLCFSSVPAEKFWDKYLEQASAASFLILSTLAFIQLLLVRSDIVTAQ
jgi:hypothetical protein